MLLVAADHVPESARCRRADHHAYAESRRIPSRPFGTGPCRPRSCRSGCPDDVFCAVPAYDADAVLAITRQDVAGSADAVPGDVVEQDPAEEFARALAPSAVVPM